MIDSPTFILSIRALDELIAEPIVRPSGLYVSSRPGTESRIAGVFVDTLESSGISPEHLSTAFDGAPKCQLAAIDAMIRESEGDDDVTALHVVLERLDSLRRRVSQSIGRAAADRASFDPHAVRAAHVYPYLRFSFSHDGLESEVDADDVQMLSEWEDLSAEAREPWIQRAYEEWRRNREDDKAGI